MINFDEFNKNLNSEDILGKINNATLTSKPIPKGDYFVSVESMELGVSSTNKVMFKASFNITDGEYQGRKLFFNRVISGTKNDASMIGGLLSILSDMGTDVDLTIKDSTRVYSEIDRIVKEVYENVTTFEYEVQYDESQFNSIKFL